MGLLDSRVTLTIRRNRQLPGKNKLFYIIWQFSFNGKLTVEVESKITVWGEKRCFYFTIDVVCVCVTDFPTCPFKHGLYLEESSQPTGEICLLSESCFLFVPSLGTRPSPELDTLQK